MYAICIRLLGLLGAKIIRKRVKYLWPIRFQVVCHIGEGANRLVFGKLELARCVNVQTQSIVSGETEEDKLLQPRLLNPSL